MFNKFWCFTFIVGLTLSGCVTTSKYRSLENEKNTCDEKARGLETKVNEQNVLINELENKLGSAKSHVDEMRTALTISSKQKQDVQKRLQEFKTLVGRFQKLMDAGKLTVKMHHGRMTVGLGSDILFASGSARLSDGGEKAIKEVTKLLVTIPNREFQIEGHTDDVPISNEVFPSNWELATARAFTVLNTMIDSGMPSERVSIASFGQFKPLMPNETPEARSANRRIEIVVVPDLSILPGYEELEKLSSAEEQTTKQ